MLHRRTDYNGEKVFIAKKTDKPNAESMLVFKRLPQGPGYETIRNNLRRGRDQLLHSHKL